MAIARARGSVRRGWQTRKPLCFFVLAIVSQILTRAQTPQTPPQQSPTQVPGTFRSTISMVPLDVRVLDRNGKPITDLRQEDFTVLEDSVPQQIRYFSSQVLQADSAPVDAPIAHRTLGPDVRPQSQRVFLILLGRCRLPASAVRSRPRYVKVIVYDYGADVLGSAVLKLK